MADRRRMMALVLAGILILGILAAAAAPLLG